MAFKPGFDQSPAFNDAGRNAWGAGAGRQQAGWGQTPQAGMTPEQLQYMYDRPSASTVDTDRMSYEDTIVKTLLAFGVLVVGAVAGWNLPPVVWIVSALVGFVLAMVNTFKKKPSPALVLAYAAFEGLFVGGISKFFEYNFAAQTGGIVAQAVFGTLGVFAVTLLLFTSGKVRATPKLTRFFLVAMVGYLAFQLVNLVLMWTGVTQGSFGLMSATLFGIPIGVLIGIFVVLMAAYSLILDFDQIKTGVQRGAPRIYAWTAAFGLIVTLVWLYLEILRILAIIASSSRN
ncbi:Bax inhibitor-1/YccA family protein [Curtobacterium luteum]|uniref:Bax inhibitor-1/YccA family protein n=1 Tax=Curtobacterium luteum TaxID=33881 RepID=UPI00380678DF